MFIREMRTFTPTRRFFNDAFLKSWKVYKRHLPEHGRENKCHPGSVGGEVLRGSVSAHHLSLL